MNNDWIIYTIILSILLSIYALVAFGPGYLAEKRRKRVNREEENVISGQRGALLNSTRNDWTLRSETLSH